MMIHSLILERQRTGRLVQSSGAMSVDPPSAERARSLGAMRVDVPATLPKPNVNIKEMSDSFINALSDATGMTVTDVKKLQG